MFVISLFTPASLQPEDLTALVLQNLKHFGRLFDRGSSKH